MTTNPYAPPTTAVSDPTRLDEVPPTVRVVLRCRPRPGEVCQGAIREILPPETLAEAVGDRRRRACRLCAVDGCCCVPHRNLHPRLRHGTRLRCCNHRLGPVVRCPGEGGGSASSAGMEIGVRTRWGAETLRLGSVRSRLRLRYVADVPALSPKHRQAPASSRARLPIGGFRQIGHRHRRRSASAGESGIGAPADGEALSTQSARVA